jgi:hypothetical protein
MRFNRVTYSGIISRRFPMTSNMCSLTTRYKCGWIYPAYIDGHEIVKFQVDAYAYVQYAKSYHAAKIYITKHDKKVKGAK